MFLKCDPDKPVSCYVERQPDLNVCMLLYVQAEQLHEHLYSATLQDSSLLRATKSPMPPIDEGSPDSIEDVLPGLNNLLQEGPSLKINGAEQRGSSTTAQDEHGKGQIQGNASEGLNSVPPGSPPGSTALERNNDSENYVDLFDNAPSPDSQQVQSVHSGQKPSAKETGSLSLRTMSVAGGGSILSRLGRSQKSHPDIDPTTRQSLPENLVARMDGIASGHGMKKHESSTRAAAGCHDINRGYGNRMDQFDQNQDLGQHILTLDVGKQDELSVLTQENFNRKE